MTALWSALRSDHCSARARERLFEQPDRFDGHEPGACPGQACTRYGDALMIAFLPAPTRTLAPMTAAA
jgi:hypothetical protein